MGNACRVIPVGIPGSCREYFDGKKKGSGALDTRGRDSGNMSQGCSLRPADWEDVDLLFSWANDTEVRKNSFSTEPIRYEEHQAWFRKKYQEKHSKIYIFCEEGQEKGMLRLDFHGNEAEISYSIAPGERRKGYGEKLILLAEKEACKTFQEMGEGIPNREAHGHRAVVRARVKKDNLASNRIFTKLGFEKCEGEYKKILDPAKSY